MSQNLVARLEALVAPFPADSLTTHLIVPIGDVREAAAELKRLGDDGERYRFVRDDVRAAVDIRVDPKGMFWPKRGEKLDAAIDAARRSKP